MRPGLHLRARQSQVFRLGQVVRLLQMSAAELDAHLAEAARDNPMLVLRPRPLAPGATDVLEMAAVAEANRTPSPLQMIGRPRSMMTHRTSLQEM